jgi:hypothetical protein
VRKYRPFADVRRTGEFDPKEVFATNNGTPQIDVEPTLRTASTAGKVRRQADRYAPDFCTAYLIDFVYVDSWCHNLELCTFGHSLANETCAIFNAASCRINRKVIPIPWLILKGCHGLPFWENETPHIGEPCFNAPPMFLTV